MANSAATVVFRTCSPRTEDVSFLELPLCSTLRTSHQVAVSGRLSTLPTPSGIVVLREADFLPRAYRTSEFSHNLDLMCSSQSADIQRWQKSLIGFSRQAKLLVKRLVL